MLPNQASSYGGFWKIQEATAHPLLQYFTWGLKPLASMKDMPFILYIMVDYGGLRMLLSKKSYGIRVYIKLVMLTLQYLNFGTVLQI